MDHIIVDHDTVVGIVGWSQADFVPEAVERLQYYFMSDPEDLSCWYRMLSNVATSRHTTRPSVEFVVNASQYNFLYAWYTQPRARRAVVDRLCRLEELDISDRMQ